MGRRNDIKEDILDIPDKNKCYVCGRTKDYFNDIRDKKILEQKSPKVKEKFNSFWEACEKELINSNLINEWIKYLDTSIDKTAVDKYSDFDMVTLERNDTFLDRIPNLPLFIHFGLEHFKNRKDAKLEEVVDYLLNVKSILEKFNKTLPLEDLNIIISFFLEFYDFESFYWDNYAVSCYLENQRRSDSEVDVTVIPIFKKVDCKAFWLPFDEFLNELNIQKSINESTFEFQHIDISLSFGDYEQPLRIFLCPICGKTIIAISNIEAKYWC